MKLKFKETQLNITLKPTEDHMGLKKEDYWYLVNLTINNDEYNYELEEKLLTNNEVEQTINTLEQYIKGSIDITEISYITNYLKINLLEEHLELTLIEKLSSNSKKYTVILDKEEVLELINILKTK